MSLNFTIETTNHYKEIKYDWKIKNFSKLTDVLEGPPFFPLSGHPIKWQNVLNFGNNTTSGNFLSVLLYSLDDEDTNPLKVVGNISFKNSQGEVWKEYSVDVIVKGGESVECLKLIKFDYRLPSAIFDLFTLSEDDVFIVEWSMTVSGIITSTVTPAPVIPTVKKEDEDICNAFKLMYKKNAFTDVTFHIGKQTITSHKAVLSARSSVFDKMFDHDTLENQTNSIEIKDFDYRIFDCFIGYLYTKEIRSEVKDDVNSLLSLYEAADKYDVLDLQKCCADILLSHFLNVNTVSPIVEMADIHNDKYLKEPAMEFIRHRFPEVADTAEWSRLMKNNIELASSIVCFVTSLVQGKI